MATYFVTRHEGAIDWALRKGIEAQLVTHLDPSKIEKGDVVLGTLPVQIIAQINERGARYLHLEMSLPADQRGIALTADDMERLGAQLIEYEARRISEN
ncbi:CRISPR-associated protein, VVA1548 family [Rhodomicrobium vannielii ATCC 17100]|uniref:CRISPR-associated protein, VVA1548 family n=2 Tax=Rhodomicrobium vannielii TaxID=1069 RepID=E3I089_RHOVT|nr:CRISPR-associated protein Csx16 [Rhodomicrobium vannielii]ADP71124.1 CRISPR-associated protein, VVA1548 family [Rhodomicrobium vannielii ATCC 17100]